jgi:RNA-directed DNA polymerase
MQQSLFNNNSISKDNNISLEDVFTAYFDCRKNKRNKADALEFELDFEGELVKLWKDINKEIYEVSPLDVFISEKPVKREIFAAQFRDRVVHHLIINKLINIFEEEFIYDSYSCRKGKGTHFGISRVKKFIRQCSENYQKECWILKLDIKGYFMSINKNILLEKLETLIENNYHKKDKEKLIYLCKNVINNDPTINCNIKSSLQKWRGLPKSKSLFFTAPNCGLPIGNYTNQIFANFYLNFLDCFIKKELKFRYYARYVDDFLMVDKDKEKLKKSIPEIENFLNKELEIKIHPNKTYLQSCFNGVEFLGVLIKPHRNYISSRVKNNFWETIKTINKVIARSETTKQSHEIATSHFVPLAMTEEKNKKILSQINSYLGVLNYTNSYNLKKNF